MIMHRMKGHRSKPGSGGMDMDFMESYEFSELPADADVSMADGENAEKVRAFRSALAAVMMMQCWCCLLDVFSHMRLLLRLFQTRTFSTLSVICLTTISWNCRNEWNEMRQKHSFR